VRELLLLTHTRGNSISHVMDEGGHHSATTVSLDSCFSDYHWN